jgi:hypothetical protein
MYHTVPLIGYVDDRVSSVLRFTIGDTKVSTFEFLYLCFHAFHISLERVDVLCDTFSMFVIDSGYYSSKKALMIV